MQDSTLNYVTDTLQAAKKKNPRITKPKSYGSLRNHNTKKIINVTARNSEILFSPSSPNRLFLKADMEPNLRQPEHTLAFLKLKFNFVREKI